MYKCKFCGETTPTNTRPCSKCNRKEFCKVVNLEAPTISEKDKGEDEDYDDFER